MYGEKIDVGLFKIIGSANSIRQTFVETAEDGTFEILQKNR
jgi:hypothetical protein